MTIILSNLNRFKNFFTGRFLGKFAVKWIFKIPPHFEYVATLPRETLSAKQAINNKLQGSVATYLRCDGVVINEIKKSLLLGLRVKKNFKISEYLAKLQQERDCLVHFAHLANTAKRQNYGHESVALLFWPTLYMLEPREHFVCKFHFFIDFFSGPGKTVGLVCVCVAEQ